MTHDMNDLDEHCGNRQRVIARPAQNNVFAAKVTQELYPQIEMKHKTKAEMTRPLVHDQHDE